MDKHNRHQIRANWHNYNDGTYFVTICTKNKLHFLGDISNGKMMHSPIGKIAHSQCAALSLHFPHIRLWHSVVMPNHLHLMLSISMDNTSTTKFNHRRGCLELMVHNKNSTKDFHHNSILSIVVRSLKGGITREAHRLGLAFEWQSRFHEHIVRHKKSFDHIMRYIDTNVENWHLDCFNDERDENMLQ